jgi:hypothetical protein
VHVRSHFAGLQWRILGLRHAALLFTTILREVSQAQPNPCEVALTLSHIDEQTSMAQKLSIVESAH